jgi:hypothetical protein
MITVDTTAIVIAIGVLNFLITFFGLIFYFKDKI